MSKPRYRWYGDVKRRIIEGDWKEPKSFQDFVLNKAIFEAEQETKNLPNSEMRIKAVVEILYDHKESYDSFALKNFYERRNVQRWITSFVNLTGKKAGF